MWDWRSDYIDKPTIKIFATSIFSQKKNTKCAKRISSVDKGVYILYHCAKYLDFHLFVSLHNGLLQTNENVKIKSPSVHIYVSWLIIHQITITVNMVSFNLVSVFLGIKGIMTFWFSICYMTFTQVGQAPFLPSVPFGTRMLSVRLFVCLSVSTNTFLDPTQSVIMIDLQYLVGQKY